jgi:UPF0755 protein
MRPRDPQTVAVLIVGALGLVRVLGTDEAVAASIRDRPAVSTGSVSVEDEVRVTIPDGALPDEIVDALARAGVASDAETLRALLLFTGSGGELKAGEYDFVLNTPPAEIVRRLRAGPDLIERITFRAGLRVEEIGETLEEVGFFTAAEWESAVANAQPRDFMGDETDFLGFLRPGTYEVDDKTTAASLLAAMLDRFAEEVTPALVAEAEANGWTLYEVLTLASLVEREAVHPEEKPLVAAVFLNRLEQGIPLQADASVQFALTIQDDGPSSVQEFGWWKRELSVFDLGLDSAYNTYYYPGLMPGPIANPDIDSIRAVIERDPAEFIYFVASPECDGHHLFAVTLDEHNANVELFRASECGSATD